MADRVRTESQKSVKNTLLSGAGATFPFENFQGSSLLVPVAKESLPAVLQDVEEIDCLGSLEPSAAQEVVPSPQPQPAQDRPSSVTQQFTGLFSSFFGSSQPQEEPPPPQPKTEESSSLVYPSSRSHSPYVQVPSVISYSPALFVPEDKPVATEPLDQTTHSKPTTTLYYSNPTPLPPPPTGPTNHPPNTNPYSQTHKAKTPVAFQTTVPQFVPVSLVPQEEHAETAESTSSSNDSIVADLQNRFSCAESKDSSSFLATDSKSQFPEAPRDLFGSHVFLGHSQAEIKSEYQDAFGIIGQPKPADSGDDNLTTDTDCDKKKFYDDEPDEIPVNRKPSVAETSFYTHPNFNTPSLNAYSGGSPGFNYHGNLNISSPHKSAHSTKGTSSAPSQFSPVYHPTSVTPQLWSPATDAATAQASGLQIIPKGGTAKYRLGSQKRLTYAPLPGLSSSSQQSQLDFAPPQPAPSQIGVFSPVQAPPLLPPTGSSQTSTVFEPSKPPGPFQEPPSNQSSTVFEPSKVPGSFQEPPQTGSRQSTALLEPFKPPTSLQEPNAGSNQSSLVFEPSKVPGSFQEHFTPQTGSRQSTTLLEPLIPPTSLQEPLKPDASSNQSKVPGSFSEPFNPYTGSIQPSTVLKPSEPLREPLIPHTGSNQPSTVLEPFSSHYNYRPGSRQSLPQPPVCFEPPPIPQAVSNQALLEPSKPGGFFQPTGQSNQSSEVLEPSFFQPSPISPATNLTENSKPSPLPPPPIGSQQTFDVFTPVPLNHPEDSPTPDLLSISTANTAPEPAIQPFFNQKDSTLPPALFQPSLGDAPPIIPTSVQNIPLPKKSPEEFLAPTSLFQTDSSSAPINIFQPVDSSPADKDKSFLAGDSETLKPSSIFSTLPTDSPVNVFQPVNLPSDPSSFFQPVDLLQPFEPLTPMDSNQSNMDQDPNNLNTIDLTETQRRRSPSPSVVPQRLLNLGQSGIIYRPPYYHWFWNNERDTDKENWQPFSMQDSLDLEEAFNSPNLSVETKVATDGTRYDVSVVFRRREAVYWNEPPWTVRRCSWFRRSDHSRDKYVPYDEETAATLEEAYKSAVVSANWNKDIYISSRERITMFGPSSILHYKTSNTPDSWQAQTDGSSQSEKALDVKRGVDDFDIDEGESEMVDHLLFMVHGIGAICDLKFRNIEDAVKDFRSMSQQLMKTHFRTAIDQGLVNRVEVLPVSWHHSLHEETGVDKKIENVTLRSIPKLRHFTNDTLLDILFYTSPTYCQKIMDRVGQELNKLYDLFLSRNPNFKGNVSLAGHSLGSLILFDMLCHQKTQPPADETDEAQTSGKKPLLHSGSYLTGLAGTGQPLITYPQLRFQTTSFFAMGSPIGMFVTVRGIDSLGLDFKLPTCPGMFNIFHPFDPVAYRIEALINPDLASTRPVLIPHHKGRKRIHLELRDTMARVGEEIKNRVLESVRTTWNTFSSFALFGRTEEALKKDVNEAIESQIRPDVSIRSGDSISEDEPVTDESQEELNVGVANRGRRIDYVLQEAPLESFNEYVSAITSHVCYWDSQDTQLFIMKEIYNQLGITADNPQMMMAAAAEELQRLKMASASPGSSPPL